MDYLEDLDCHRKPKPQKAYNQIKKELMKLVPEHFEIALLPAFFNHTDGDRIATIIKDTSVHFFENTPKKVIWSIGVKVFPYGSGINSVRIVIIKLHEMDGLDDDEESPQKSKKGSSSKSKKSKSKKSQNGEDPAK